VPGGLNFFPKKLANRKLYFIIYSSQYFVNSEYQNLSKIVGFYERETKPRKSPPTEGHQARPGGNYSKGWLSILR
jgi:hypothetical protein